MRHIICCRSNYIWNFYRFSAICLKIESFHKTSLISLWAYIVIYSFKNWDCFFSLEVRVMGQSIPQSFIISSAIEPWHPEGVYLFRPRTPFGVYQINISTTTTISIFTFQNQDKNRRPNKSPGKSGQVSAKRQHRQWQNHRKPRQGCLQIDCHLSQSHQRNEVDFSA